MQNLIAIHPFIFYAVIQDAPFIIIFKSTQQVFNKFSLSFRIKFYLVFLKGLAQFVQV